MSRAKRVDANQSAIVAALRDIGAFVQPLHMVGQGVPDLLVIYRGKIHVAEVKDGSKPKSARKLTEAEIEWQHEAGRHGYTVPTWENVEQAVGDVVFNVRI